MWVCAGACSAYTGATDPASLTQGFAMNGPMTMDPIDVLRARLAVLEREHRDLDEAIRALEEKGTGDALAIRRLKKQKLFLKDRIRLLEDQINPDIIA
jgi:hypothetical protein